MLSKRKMGEIMEYWLKGGEDNYHTMLSLYCCKRYSACLFFGHLILEKALKALIVSKTGSHAPYTHDLCILAEKVEFEPSRSDLELLKKANNFNVNARYPDWQLEFYKSCDKIYADRYYSRIKHLYKEICQQVKQS